jgi:uncharacterized damage-inducible protein DinB
MTISALGGHIAELPGWISMAFTTDGWDFARDPYTPPVWNTTEELLAFFEKNFEGAKTYLENGKEEGWTLSNGAQTYMNITKAELVRLALNQTVHHRAQLGVYLRLLDIPIPGTYGPSADESF